VLDEVILIVLLALLHKGATSTSTSAPVPPPGGATLKPGDLLIPGASYRATIELTGLEATFGTSGAVQSKLEAAGFKGVAVVDHGGGSFEATGTWGGAAVPAKLPEQVKTVVRT